MASYFTEKKIVQVVYSVWHQTSSTFISKVKKEAQWDQAFPKIT